MNNIKFLLIAFLAVSGVVSASVKKNETNTEASNGCDWSKGDFCW